MKKLLGKSQGWVALPFLLAIALPAVAQTPAVRVAAGAYHTCAILVGGNMKCWGYNAYGQLGLGDTVTRGDAPGQMGSALPTVYFPKHGPVKQLALGGFHTCALDTVGDVYCWGYNTSGQLGYGHTNNLGDNPSEVWGGMPPAVIETQKIVAGEYHTCALKFGGAVWCWGYNAYGQLGAGDTQNRRDGVNNSFAIPNLGTGRKAVDIAAAGYSTCALLDNQQVKCWGYNGVGTLGLGDNLTRGDGPGEMGDSLPAVDTGFSGWAFKEIVAGRFHVCAVRANNAWPKCWGYNTFGQLGLGDTNNRGDSAGEMGASLPLMPSGSQTWEMAAGYAHTCVPTPSGFTSRYRIKCFGYNGFGQLGVGDTANRGDNPGEVAYGQPPAVDLGLDSSGFHHQVIGMAAGNYHTCAVLVTGAIKCWGYNALGQLGLGNSTDRGTDPAQMGAALPEVDL
jgi:alpha-tubulin suppressor-like RCC1 family protein